MAKLRLPQISWHGREPVLSVDVSKGGLLATGGSDNEVRLWRVNVGAQSGEAVSFVQDLSGHAKPVNAVRSAYYARGPGFFYLYVGESWSERCRCRFGFLLCAAARCGWAEAMLVFSAAGLQGAGNGGGLAVFL